MASQDIINPEIWERVPRGVPLTICVVLFIFFIGQTLLSMSFNGTVYEILTSFYSNINLVNIIVFCLPFLAIYFYARNCPEIRLYSFKGKSLVKAKLIEKNNKELKFKIIIPFEFFNNGKREGSIYGLKAEPNFPNIKKSYFKKIFINPPKIKIGERQISPGYIKPLPIPKKGLLKGEITFVLILKDMKETTARRLFKEDLRVLIVSIIYTISREKDISNINKRIKLKLEGEIK